MQNISNHAIIHHMSRATQEGEKHLTVPFYSFRGGCGVSLTAANVARYLAEREHKVLLIDANFTSPGLTHLPEFSRQQENRVGMADYLTDAWEGNSIPNLTLYSHLVPGSDNLTFMPAGNIHRTIAFWNDIFEPQNDRSKLSLFLTLKNSWEKEGFEYTIIDTPSGFTNMGIICTRLLPDALVILYRLGRMTHHETVNVLQLARKNIISNTEIPILLGLSMIPRPIDAIERAVYNQTIAELPRELKPPIKSNEDFFQLPLEPYLPLIADSKYYEYATRLGQGYRRLAQRLESIRN